MSGEVSKALVVDASLSRGAGQPGSANPHAVSCRTILRSIQRICHRIVLSEEFRAEWERRETDALFAKEWRLGMDNMGKVLGCSEGADAALLDEILATLHPQEYAATRKDFHLIEAALAYDGIILSLDGTAYRRFRRAAHTIGPLQGLVWPDPRRWDVADLLAWLQSGAPPRDEFLLGTALDPD